MKKEFSQRVNVNALHRKQDTYTNLPIKKQSRRITRKKLTHKNHLDCKVEQAKTQSQTKQPMLKSQPQSCQTTLDTPSHPDIIPYMSEISSHMINLDIEFHSKLGQRLNIAGDISISSEMRKILIKWLVKVAAKFCVKSQTMHMCVQLIDYMLIYKEEIYNKTNFQLLGITCLFMSCKYNEIYTIQAQKYIELCDGIYTCEQLLEMQSKILLQVDFNLQLPNLHQFINKMVFDYKIDHVHYQLIKSIADLFIFDFNSFNSYMKQQLAIVIVYFASKLCKLDSLKIMLSEQKNKIQPQIFKQCFIAVVTLFKKSHLNTMTV